MWNQLTVLLLLLTFLAACDTGNGQSINEPMAEEEQPEETEDATAANNSTPAIDTLFTGYPPDMQAALTADTTGAAAWVDATLAAMSLDEKIAQLFIVNLPTYGSLNQLRNSREMQLVREHGVGGVLVSRALHPEEVHEQVTLLQSESAQPLFIAADYERGSGRFNSTATELPSNMAIGATRDASLAAAAGKVTALESRAAGVNFAFAPVVDVNNNPNNPIINIRSYGEDATMVGQMGAAFVRAAEEVGLLTSLKHFPGHGDTSVDTHAELGAVSSSRQQLDEVELAPYRYILGEQGLHPAGVMTAHLWMQAIDEEPLPATFSNRALSGLLRGEMGYGGLIITDDVEMGALRNNYNAAERILRPIEAGVDILLMPRDVPGAIQEIRQAISEGRITEERIDDSARRVLKAKAKAGLHNERHPPRELLDNMLEEARGEVVAGLTADRATTLLRTSGQLPLQSDRRALLMQISNFGGAPSIEAAKEEFASILSEERDIDTFSLDVEPSSVQRQRAIAAAHDADVVVLGLFLRLESGRGEAGLHPQQSELVEALLDLDTPVVLVTFGNPYVVATYPRFDAALVAYDQTLASVRSAASVLMGQKQLHGRLPITVGEFPRGSGLRNLEGDQLEAAE